MLPVFLSGMLSESFRNEYLREYRPQSVKKCLEAETWNQTCRFVRDREEAAKVEQACEQTFKSIGTSKEITNISHGQLEAVRCPDDDYLAIEPRYG